ncbi:MAG: hypothetical protein ACHQNE_05830 [Candidatus Kapaibacterium sp.]
MKHKRVRAITLVFIEKAGMVLIAFALAGCVINFKNPVPITKGVIHVDMHYIYPDRNEFSTYDKFYKKEVAPGRFAETKDIQLDPGQQLLVLNKALVLHFYNMPDSFFHIGRAAGEPHYIRISADTLDKTVHWTGSLDSLHPAGQHLQELVEYVDSIVTSTEAYQALPAYKE